MSYEPRTPEEMVALANAIIECENDDMARMQSMLWRATAQVCHRLDNLIHVATHPPYVITVNEGGDVQIDEVDK